MLDKIIRDFIGGNRGNTLNGFSQKRRMIIRVKHRSDPQPGEIAVSRTTNFLRIVGVEKEMRKDQRLADLI